MLDISHSNLRTNSLFVSAGAIIRFAVSLISIPLLLKYLGLERYGVWVILNSAIAIAGLMELGLSTAFSNYLSIDYARQDWISANRTVATSFLLVTFLGILMSVGFKLANPLIGHVFIVQDSTKLEVLLALGVMSWQLLLRFWQQWAMAAEAGLLRYDIQSSIETVSAVISQVGLILLALTGSSLGLLATWSLIVTGVSVVFHFLVLKRLFSGRLFRFCYSSQAANYLFRFGVAHWLATLGSSLFGYADRILVNLILGSSAAGLYSVATSIAIQINTLSAIPLRVLPPAISAAKSLSQNSRIRQIFLNATRINGLLVFLVMAPILFLASYISYLFVGKVEAVRTAEILRIIVLSYGLYSLSAAGFYTSIGIGSPILNARWGIIGALFSLSLLAVFTSWFGLKGAAWGNIGYAVVLIINFQVVKTIDLDYRTYIKTFIPSLTMVFLWSLCFICIKIDLLPIWYFVLLFILFIIPSIFYISGRIFLKEIINMVIKTFNTSLFNGKFS